MNSNYAPDRFIGDLDYALKRLVADPKDIVGVTVRMLGQYTGVDRCDYAEVEADRDHFVILGDYTQGRYEHHYGPVSAVRLRCKRAVAGRPRLRRR